MSAKSTPHILSLNCEYTFLLLNFLVTGLCNSSAKILLTSFVRYRELGFAVCFALPLPDIVFCRVEQLLSQKIYIPYQLNLFDNHYILDY